MGVVAPMTIASATVFLLLMVLQPSTAALDARYYDRSCPQADNIILETVRNASVYDPKVPARILRMFFHDCFIRGCDASVLLDSTPANQAEKDAPPNVSLRSFYVIDDAKTKLESACPATVSCADILAIAARDVVALVRIFQAALRPSATTRETQLTLHTNQRVWWASLECAQRKETGRISEANNTINLPSPSFNVTQLIQSFENRGLGVKDLVALSGGHALGFSHCSSFESRICNFSQIEDVDPSMDDVFAEKLRMKCRRPNKDPGAGEFLDSTSSIFDNDYYKRLMGGKGLFGSDQALYSDDRTRPIVEAFGRDEGLFFREFVASM